MWQPTLHEKITTGNGHWANQEHGRRLRVSTGTPRRTAFVAYTSTGPRSGVVGQDEYASDSYHGPALLQRRLAVTRTL